MSKTVIEMAQSVGATKYTNRHYLDRPVYTFSSDRLERLVELARADEREACAQVCDELPAPDSCSGSESSLWDVATLECGDAIRARSNTRPA